MKKLITRMSLLALLLAPAIVSAQDFASQCVEPKGELMGTINFLKADGFVVTNIQCAVINYLVAPTPPYLNSIITVQMRKIQCPTVGTGPCLLLGTAYITADEIVQNSVGITLHTNVSMPAIAL